MKSQGLSSTERIKSKKDFERLYSTGKILFSKDKKVKAIFVEESNQLLPGIKIAVAVSRKAGSAVWRNRVKRLFREAYRLNKDILSGLSASKNVLIKIVFSPNLLNQKNNRIINLHDLLPGVLDVMLRIKRSL